MENVVPFRAKKKKKPVVIDGVRYVPVEEAAERIGVEVKTLYSWNNSGEGPDGIRYLGRLYYSDSGIESFKKSLMTKIKVCRK